MTEPKLADLCKPFPAAAVGKLPKITCGACSKSATKVCSDHTKKQCRTCSNYITERHTHLDYVGHAHVTERLLQVDPQYSWEPVAFDDKGLPLMVGGGMWIKLTVLGVTRLGYGDAGGKQGPEATKEVIGDALRNAAMRFGVALDLWMKDGPSPIDEGSSPGGVRQPARASAQAPRETAASVRGELWALAQGKGMTQDELAAEFTLWSDGEVAIASAPIEKLRLFKTTLEVPK